MWRSPPHLPCADQSKTRLVGTSEEPASPAVSREVSRTHGRAFCGSSRGRALGAGDGAPFTGGATSTRRPKAPDCQSGRARQRRMALVLGAGVTPAVATAIEKSAQRIFFSLMRPRAKDRPRDFAIHTAGAGAAAPGRGDGSAVLSRWQGPARDNGARP